MGRKWVGAPVNQSALYHSAVHALLARRTSLVPGSPGGSLLGVGSLPSTTGEPKARHRDTSWHRVGERGGGDQLLRGAPPREE